MARRSLSSTPVNPSIFRYVVRYDSGVAPRPFDGYCTLAICKPQIRARARKGDWVVGFRTRAPGEVIYAMLVEEVLTFAQYWADPRFRNRRPDATGTPDNIYRPARSETLEQVPNPVHDETATATDIGGRNVLVSRQFWYFGSNSPPISTELIHLVHAGRGHAVHKNRRPRDIDQLNAWLSAWQIGIHGSPVDPTLVNREQKNRGIPCGRASAKVHAPNPRSCTGKNSTQHRPGRVAAEAHAGVYAERRGATQRTGEAVKAVSFEAKPAQTLEGAQ